MKHLHKTSKSAINACQNILEHKSRVLAFKASVHPVEIKYWKICILKLWLPFGENFYSFLNGIISHVQMHARSSIAKQQGPFKGGCSTRRQVINRRSETVTVLNYLNIHKFVLQRPQYDTPRSYGSSWLLSTIAKLYNKEQSVNDRSPSHNASTLPCPASPRPC